jgi:cytohesin
VRAFLLTCKATHSLDDTLLKADWLEQQRPATALHIAAGPNGSEELMLQLLSRPSMERGASGPVDSRGAPLLVKACGAGYKRAVQRLLSEPGFDPNVADAEGYTGLIAAAQWGHVGVVEELLQAPGIRLELGDRRGNRTALHCASRKGHAEVVRMLIRAGANVNQRKSGGGTPLLLASRSNRIAVFREILSCPKGVQGIDMANNGGQTPLSEARAKGYTEVVALLKQHRA